ncbi:muscle, skeletal receptor tyrosine-protein kinase-like isoform X2 [Palaemon carinicauda]|uniref:muscle, skeletal receptor tyrosine-protein kinase-like isoform X2 n=1 Tax=Palaemon carinicauda TaxID=392227 RepID=UPI0035B60163
MSRRRRTDIGTTAIVERTTATVSPTTTATSVVTVMSLVIAIASGVRGEMGETTDVFPGAPPIQYSSLSGPTFVTPNRTTVQAVAGTTAMLPCAVKNLHNYTVSWVRGRDIRLLTAATATYTSEERFVVAKLAGGSQWLLKIHYVRLNDAGVYLCQVSTSPPITLSIDLSVQESVVRVLPGPEVYVQLGSRLEVICQVEGCPPPALLTWTRAGNPLATGAPVETFNIMEKNMSVPVAKLTLFKAVASAADTGNYSCSSKCTKNVGVAVHVLKVSSHAASQQKQAAPAKLYGDRLSDGLANAALALALRKKLHQQQQQQQQQQRNHSTP